MPAIKSFEDLKIWQEGHRLTLEIHRVSIDFPVEEGYGLTSQLCRAAVSVPQNIAEAKGRSSAKDYCRFFWIARGSRQERLSLLILARDLGFVAREQSSDLLVR